MTELAIDIAGAGCSVALRHVGTGGVCSRYIEGGRGQSERVLGLIQELLDETGSDYDSLKRIICTIGPGSFTGLRVGIALSKGLSLASGAPLYGASRTLVLGHKFYCLERAVCADRGFCSVLNAGRGEVFVQAFLGDDTKSLLAMGAQTLEPKGVALDDHLPAEIILAEDLSGFSQRFGIKRFVGIEGDELSPIANLSQLPLWLRIRCPQI